jgi:hypothetical protein
MPGEICDVQCFHWARCRDTGSAILKDILAEGARGGEMFNPALALYERLGFWKRREFGV